MKYCPYGPFVEQSPILPPIRKEAEEHNKYINKCLETNTIGSIYDASDEILEYNTKLLNEAKKDIRILLPIVLREKEKEELLKYGAENDLKLFEVFGTPVDIKSYQLPFPLDKEKEKELEQKLMGSDITDEMQNLLEKKLKEIENIIQTKKINGIENLDSTRKKYFEELSNEFNLEDYPESIPKSVTEMQCSIFGHICPVVFVGEDITETVENRRIGRYIPFKTKIRVVRRDNYTCQECGKHLQDDEVEFDHIIPFSKGGSSEEQNIRLTCFDCNRGTLDNYEA